MGTGSRSTVLKELPASLFFLLNSKNKKKLGNVAEISGAETERRRVVQRRIGGAEMALPPYTYIVLQYKKKVVSGNLLYI